MEAGRQFAASSASRLQRAEAHDRLRPHGKVRGYTYQGIKGLQFDAVAIVDVARGYLPYGDLSDLWGDARKLYVGLTRAKRFMAIHAPSDAGSRSLFYEILIGESEAESVIGSPVPASLSC